MDAAFIFLGPIRLHALAKFPIITIVINLTILEFLVARDKAFEFSDSLEITCVLTDVLALS
jgi:hypothetical protein